MRSCVTFAGASALVSPSQAQAASSHPWVCSCSPGRSSTALVKKP